LSPASFSRVTILSAIAVSDRDVHGALSQDRLTLGGGMGREKQVVVRTDQRTHLDGGFLLAHIHHRAAARE
jgi:hypothetical protein